MNVYAVAQDVLILNYLQKNLLLRHPDMLEQPLLFRFYHPFFILKHRGHFFFLNKTDPFGLIKKSPTFGCLDPR